MLKTIADCRGIRDYRQPGVGSGPADPPSSLALSTPRQVGGVEV